MEQIIANLLVADNEIIKKATADLQEAYKHPETVPTLCNLVVTANDSQIRQFSAVLLRKRLSKRCNWDMIPPEQQQIIKQGMLNALIQEKEKSVRNAAAQFVGILVKHESDKKDPWMSEVLQFIFQHCSSADPVQNELGSSVFAQLTDTAPDQFIPHMEAICEMFTHVLVHAEASGNMANPVLYNILLGMGYLVPFILGHNNAEHTYQKSIPLVIKSLRAFSKQDTDKFVKAFDILENLADYTPKLLTINIQPLLEFCLELANNNQVDGAVRVKAVEYIGWLVRLKKKIIVKQKLVEPIMQVIFNLMATESPDEEDEDDEEYFLGSDSTNPMTTATQTMDLLALHVPPEKLIPPLLQLLEPALRGQDPLAKKASYLCIAVIAEGCSEAICAKYLPNLLEVVKMGLTDSNPIVRNAAFFALGQFSEHLQPDITKYAPEILPILFQFLQQLCNELKAGSAEPKHIDRMFYALETFCENLEDAIVPHLPILMERLIEALDSKNSVRLRELALSAVSSAANAAKTNMLPYFPHLIEGLKLYLVKTDDKDIIALQPQAIDTLAALARTIGKENFMPLANDTMAFALQLLTEADDPDLRRAIYNLIASMSEIANEDMATVFPQIMERLHESILSTDEVIPQFKESEINITLKTNGDMHNNTNDEIDIEQSDDEDDDENIAGFSVENSYLDEKEEAILTLKEFAEHTGAAFIPYLQKSYENVYKMIDHPQEDIRKVSIDALCSFIVALFKQNDIQGASNAVALLIPKLGQIIKDDEDCTVAMAALEGFGQLLKELKSVAIPNDEMRDIIFTCINDVMNGKVACQFDEPTGDEEQEESEYDEALVESAGNILPMLGHAMEPGQFAMCFGRILPILVQKIEKTRGKEEFESQRSFAYGALSECFAPLQNYTGTYFHDLLPIMLAGQNDNCDQVRQNSVYGIGEMVLYAEDKSFESYPQILTALSNAVSVEKHQGTLDNIIGSISRLILTNSNLIPLEQVLPVYMEHLPLKEDFDENSSVFKCLQSLYVQGKNEILPFIEKIILIAIHVLCKQEYKNQETYDNILALTREIRDKFPDKFMSLVNSNTEVANYVQNL